MYEIRQGPQHLLWTAVTACCIYCNYVRKNRSVISSLTFYTACPFIRFVDLQTPFRWSLNIKKMKLENGGESIVNRASQNKRRCELKSFALHFVFQHSLWLLLQQFNTGTLTATRFRFFCKYYRCESRFYNVVFRASINTMMNILPILILLC